MIRLDELVRVRGIKIIELAESARISQPHCSLLVAGKVGASLEVASRIAAALNWPLSEIQFGYDRKKKDDTDKARETVKS